MSGNKVGTSELENRERERERERERQRERETDRQTRLADIQSKILKERVEKAEKEIERDNSFRP